MSVKLGTYETVVSKLDIRQFKNLDVSNEIRQKILEAARQVGTGLNSQHLRFVLIDSKDMLQLLGLKIDQRRLGLWSKLCDHDSHKLRLWF